MRVYHFLLIVVFSSNIIYSQDCSNYFNDKFGGMGLTIKGKKSHPKKLLYSIHKAEHCLGYATSKKDSAKIMRMYASIVFNYSYSGINEIDKIHMVSDTLVNLIVKSYKLDSINFCKEYKSLKEDANNPEMPWNPFFLDLIENPEVVKIKSQCLGNEYKSFKANIKEAGTGLKKDKILNQIYFCSLRNLEMTDQKYRSKEGIVDRKGQSMLDSLNRVSLDSIYNVYGFPSINLVGEDGCNKAWLILQHSTDCQWNEKWILRTFDAYNDGISKFFYYTMNRFYNKENGYCIKKCSTHSIAFIKKLKHKYPEILKKLELEDILP